MPSLKMNLDHKLNQDEALQRIRGLLKEVTNQYADKISQLKETWNSDGCDFSFKAMGFSVSGTLKVTSSSVSLDGSLPFAALPFKGRIETTLKERASRLLA